MRAHLKDLPFFHLHSILYILHQGTWYVAEQSLFGPTFYTTTGLAEYCQSSALSPCDILESPLPTLYLQARSVIIIVHYQLLTTSWTREM